jgi:hypothetical protein
VVVVSSRRYPGAVLLRAWLAAPFAPRVGSTAGGGALFQGTVLSLGYPLVSPAPLPAAEVEAWGAPTGVALSADAERIYLGQRRADGRERLVEIRRSCS